MRTHTRPRPRRASLVAVLLAVAVTFSTLPAVGGDSVRADGFAVHDDETVYVVADAYGTPRDTIVVSWLRVLGEGTIVLDDPGDIEAPEALEDEIEPELTDSGVQWTLDIDGRRDFFYRANTARELPISVEVTYYLDDREVDVEALAGASGHVRIDITLTNNLVRTEEVVYTDADGVARSEDVEFWVPMLAPVKIDVDGTRFRNIVGDAEIVTVTGSTVSHTFMAFPQPEDTVSIEMDGTDIEIDPIVVSVFPKMAGSPDFSMADDLAELRDGLDGLTALSEGHREVLGAVADGIDPAELAGVSEAGAGFEQLAEGAAQIGEGADGLAALLDGQIAYLDGVIAGLGAQELAGVTQIPDALAGLAAGVADIRDGVDGLVALLGGQVAYLDAIAESNAGLEGQAWALASASPDETTTALATGLSAQGAMLYALRDGDPAMGMPLGLADTRDRLQEISDGLTTIASSLDGLAAGSAPLAGLPGQFDALAAALATLRDGGMVRGRQLPGLVTTRSGLLGVADGIGQVGDGIGQAAAALAPLEELPGMLEELRATMLALRDGGSVRGTELPGISTTVEGLSGASEGLAEGIDGFSLGEVTVDRMKKAAEGYDTFLGKPDDATGNVRFVFKLDGVVKTAE
ncbi:MAG: hypothetical protein ACNA76_04375 [Anaerosomatales bacterium]